MLWAMERKNVTAMVVMDLSATFDTVDPQHTTKHSRKQIWHKGCSTEMVRVLLET